MTGAPIDDVTLRCAHGHEWTVTAYTTEKHLVLRVADNDCPHDGTRGRWIADGPDAAWPDA